MRQHKGMKPQDCVVLLGIVALEKDSWMAKNLAQRLGLSQAEVSMSLERSRFARLLDDTKRRVNTRAFLDFLVYGLRVVFPVQLGGMTRGIPTAWSAPPLAESFQTGNPVVWPFEEGSLRGEAIEPLYPSIPGMVAGWPDLHELLALVDALRVGRAREMDLAKQHLQQQFEAYAKRSKY